MSGTPPGWYPDAQGVSRWFDGTSWTEHVQDAAPAAPPPPTAPPSPTSPPPAATPPYGQPAYPPSAPPAYQPAYEQPYGQPVHPTPGAPGSSGQGRRTGLIVGLSSAGVLLVVLAVVGAILLAGGSDDTDEASGGTTTSAEPTSDLTVSSATPSIATITPIEPPSEPPTSEPVPDPAPAGSGEPEQVADGFMKAVFAGDCKAAEAFVSDRLLATEGSCGGSDIPVGTFDGLTYEVGRAKIDGDDATVPVTFVVDLGDDVDLGEIPGTTLTMTLKKQGSRWLVANLA